MHAVTVEENAVAWAERPTPTPESGEVLVRVMSAGLNGADRLQIAGLYPAPADSPADILGLEFAGTVEQLGAGCRRFAVGDRVMGVVGGGGQAEFIAVHERLAMPIPDALAFDAAGGFPEVVTTAHDAIFTQAALQLGERICIHGAAGGVGVAAIQLARAAGAFVTATARDASRHDDLRALGAHRVMTPDEFGSDGSTFDVILELVGAPNISGNLRSLATHGRIVVIGVGAGAKAEVNLLELMNRRAHLMGSTLRSRSLEDKAAAARAVERHALPLVGSGQLTIPIHRSFVMRDAAAAHAAFASGSKLGKIVVTAEQ